MPNNICQVLTPKVSSRFIGKVTVPNGGLVAGNIVLADTLDNSIFGNIEVFTAQKPLTENLGSTSFALVVNDGFEVLNDGRRPQGNPNYFNYEYKEGEVATVVFLGSHLRFNIGLDAIESSTIPLAVAGNFLIPTNNSYKLSAVASVPSEVNSALEILGFYNTSLGGSFSGEFATTLICTPVVDDIVDTGTSIYSFSLPNQVGSSIIDQTNGTITAVVAGSRSSMAASFTTSRDAVVKVGSTIQVSGTTTNNFTSAVTYTVTSESGDTKTYVVSVSLETYDLSITEDDHVTVSVTKGGNPVSTGEDVLTYGDSVVITATPDSEFVLRTLTVNRRFFVSGDSLTVTNDVSIVAKSELIPYTLHVSNPEHLSFSVRRNSEILVTGAIIHAGEVLILNGAGGKKITITVDGQETIEVVNPMNYKYTVIKDTYISVESIA